MKILIGAPVYRREWILPDWFAAIEAQNIPLSWLGFSFLLSPHDDGTLHSLLQWFESHPEVWAFDISFDKDNEHTTHNEKGSRKWSHDRYRAMVDFRNALLDRARTYEPDKYFSLDTDILLEDENTIRHLAELTDIKADAASPLMFMTPNNIMAPSTMTWGYDGTKGTRRKVYPFGTDFQTDVIMAAKMMNPEVYRKSSYRFHSQGEDLGWSLSCKENGFKLYCASSIYAPHIMSKDMLQSYRQHGDLRALILKKKLQNSV